MPSLLVLLVSLLTIAVPRGALAVAELDGTAVAMRLLKTKCFSCHDEKKHKGDLVMTSLAALLKGGESGPAIVPGAPAESALIAALAADADPHMPPKKQLSAGQIETLSEWVKAGAIWDDAALVEQPRVVALAPLPATYRPVLALALSPDSQRLAVGCGSELVIFELAEKSLTFLARASAHPDPVQSVAWSPDGARLATGAFRRVVVWDASDLTPVQEFTGGLTDRITALRFLPGGQQLALADGRIGTAGVVQIADLSGGGITTSWAAHSDTIFDLAVSADGRLLATAGGDKLVKVWDLATQLETARIEAHATQVLALAFKPDATQLVSGGADQQLKVWDVKTRDRIMLLGKHAAAINGVAWASAGPVLFAATDAGSVLRYSDFKPHSGAESSESANERKLENADAALACIAATANGERVFAGSHDGRVLGWNKDGKLVTRIDVQVKAEMAGK